ncbi:DNA repair protein complementing XP-C cells homolog [Panonychus citri]|uniref:DNA repair protein complementing XP-C cells homolog n=1 Tax=Panonychus citri TaxID=50023 RepID=UPI002307124B|nr:DNA repair protein complementing XP-C cells homolog [Panonychus citri]
MGRPRKKISVTPSQEKNKKLKKNDEISDGDDSDEESEDWEEVEEAEIDDDEGDKEEALANYKPQLPEQGVQISIDGPKIFNKKRRKKQVDVGEILRQQLNRMKKEVQIEMHKTHLLCLLSRGFYLNHITRNPLISSYALSYLTDFTFDLKKVNLLFVRDFTNWFRSWFTLDKKIRSKTVDLIESLTKAFGTRSVNSLVEYVLMFISLLRIYSPKIQVRLCYALNPVPIKPDDLV